MSSRQPLSGVRITIGLVLEGGENVRGRLGGPTPK